MGINKRQEAGAGGRRQEQEAGSRRQEAGSRRQDDTRQYVYEPLG